jgi:hypothetical protein
MPRLITATEVAELLGITRLQFLARRRRLEAEHDFPAAVAGLPDRWDPLAIEGWLASQRRASPPGPDPAAEAEAVLISRARAMHAAAGRGG